MGPRIQPLVLQIVWCGGQCTLFYIVLEKSCRWDTTSVSSMPDVGMHVLVCRIGLCARILSKAWLISMKAAEQYRLFSKLLWILLTNRWACSTVLCFLLNKNWWEGISLLSSMMGVSRWSSIFYRILDRIGRRLIGRYDAMSSDFFPVLRSLWFVLHSTDKESVQFVVLRYIFVLSFGGLFGKVPEGLFLWSNLSLGPSWDGFHIWWHF